METPIKRHQAFDALRSKLIALSDEANAMALECCGHDRNSELLAESIAQMLTGAAQVAEAESGRLYPQTFQQRISEVLFQFDKQVAA